MTNRLLFISAMIACVSFAGCGPVERELKQAQQTVKSTREQTMQNLQRIQQHGLVDLEVQQIFQAIADSYQTAVERNGVGPANWLELQQVASSSILLGDAQQRNTQLAFGLTAEQFRDPDRQSQFLALMPQLDSGGWGLEVGGAMRELSALEFETATLANQ